MRPLLLGLLLLTGIPRPSIADDLRSYFPTDASHSWAYSTTKHSTITAGPQSRQSEKRGTITERVVEHRAPMVVFHRIVNETNSTMGNVTVESVLHIRVEPSSIAVVAMGANGFKSPAQPLSVPQPLLRQEIPGPTIDGAQGTLRFKTQLVSQSPSSTESPAGKFSDCLLAVTKGSVFGSLSGAPVQSGSIEIQSWYARGVGLVREDRDLRFTIGAPDGGSVAIQEVTSKVLTAHTAQ